MAKHEISNYSIRLWSTRLLKMPMSIGVAMQAVYVFDEESKHRGTISFFPNNLADLLDPAQLQPPMAVVSADRIELRLSESDFADTVEILKSEEPICIYYNGPTDAGICACSEL